MLGFDELELLFVVLVVPCDAVPVDPLWDAAMAVPPPASTAAVAASASTDRGACTVPPFLGFDTPQLTGPR